MFITRYPEFRTLVAESHLTVAILDDLHQKIIDRYRYLAAKLPADHAWRDGKVRHALKAWEEAKTLGPDLFGFNELETVVFGVLLLSHDLGRLVEAERQVLGETKKPWNHGVDSVTELNKIGISASTDFWKAFLYAIEHHPDMHTPTVEELHGDVATWCMLSLLRGIDKVSGYEKAPKYIEPEEKRRQIAANWHHRRAAEPTAGDETGEIKQELIDIFAAQRSIPRDKCDCYEELILLFLAYWHDVELPEIKILINQSGGPKVFVDYFRAQLKNQDHIAVIEKTCRSCRMVID